MIRRRNGFTFIELLMVFVIFGLVFAFAMPRFVSIRTRYNVHSARDRIAATLATARAAAIRNGRTATFRRSGNAILVTSSNGVTVDTVVRPADLNGEFGVTLTATSDAVGFNPRGFSTLTATQKFVVTYAGASDSVCISPRGIVNAKGCL